MADPYEPIDYLANMTDVSLLSDNVLSDMADMGDEAAAAELDRREKEGELVEEEPEEE